MAETKRGRLEFDYLPLDKIDVSLSNVRKSNLEEGIEDLARSIEEIDVQQPVVVFEKKEERGRRYELIIGQRRYLACKMLGKKRIPALITKVRDKTDALIKSFSENIHRLDLDYRDKMRVATELLNKYGSINKVASLLGVSSQTVKRYLGYAAVPDDIKKMVDEGKLGATTAIEIVQNIEDENKALQIALSIEELPRSETRGYLIDIARENPNKSAKSILSMAKKRSKMKRIIIHVTQKIYDAVIQACKKYDLEKEWIVREAVEEWLTKKGFIK